MGCGHFVSDRDGCGSARGVPLLASKAYGKEKGYIRDVLQTQLFIEIGDLRTANTSLAIPVSPFL